MKKVTYRTVPMILLGLIVLFSFSSTTDAEKRYKYGAKTPPPQEEVNSLGMFDSNHKYLLDGTNMISRYDTDIVQLEGTTYAKQIVDSIGVTFYLQKWNGSSWEDVGTGSTYNGSNQDVYDKTIHRSAEAGYYYRVKTIHWVSHDGTYEQGERVSDYILMK
jgi:hypothetical protein